MSKKESKYNGSNNSNEEDSKSGLGKKNVRKSETNSKILCSYLILTRNKWRNSKHRNSTGLMKTIATSTFYTKSISITSLIFGTLDKSLIQKKDNLSIKPHSKNKRKERSLFSFNNTFGEAFTYILLWVSSSEICSAKSSSTRPESGRKSFLLKLIATIKTVFFFRKETLERWGLNTTILLSLKNLLEKLLPNKIGWILVRTTNAR